MYDMFTATVYKLTYDMHDNLIAMEDKEDIVIVITDNIGTPPTVFNITEISSKNSNCHHLELCWKVPMRT